MNEEWWYKINNQQLGPVATDELRKLRQAGKISDTTLVWQRGLARWQPLAEALPAATATRLPPRSRSRGKAIPALPESELPLAGPIRRFFARQIDAGFFTPPLFVLILMFRVLTGGHMPEPDFWKSGLSSILLTVCCGALLLAIEAFFFSIFHTTPGKFLLGIHVRNIDEQIPTGKEYFLRLCGLFWYGLGLNLFILPLITMFMQYLRLADSRPTRYDEDKFMILATRISGLRVLGAIALLLVYWLACIFIGLFILSAFGSTNHPLPDTLHGSGRFPA